MHEWMGTRVSHLSNTIGPPAALPAWCAHVPGLPDIAGQKSFHLVEMDS